MGKDGLESLVVWWGRLNLLQMINWCVELSR